jgi:ubiquitin-protein ligase
MQSSFQLLVKKQIDELENEPDITVKQLSGDFSELIAMIEVLKPSIWQHGLFQIYLKLDEYYGQKAPLVVSFHTVPYHPNIDKATGRPSIDFLSEPSKWRSHYTLKYILRSLQRMLDTPCMDKVINLDAMLMLKSCPDSYFHLAEQSVLESKRLSKHFKELTFINDIISLADQEQQQPNENAVDILKQLKQNKIEEPLIIEKQALAITLSECKLKNRIAYDSYFKFWHCIATSKPSTYEEDNSLPRQLDFIPYRFSIDMNDNSQQCRRNFDDCIVNKLTGINKIRTEITSKCKETAQNISNQAKKEEEEEILDKQVDELLDWINHI